MERAWRPWFANTSEGSQVAGYVVAYKGLQYGGWRLPGGGGYRQGVWCSWRRGCSEASQLMALAAGLQGQLGSSCSARWRSGEGRVAAAPARPGAGMLNLAVRARKAACPAR